MARIDAFLKLGLAQGCSDVHLAVGVPPMLRMNGDLLPIKFRDLSENELETYLLEILTNKQKDRLNEGHDLDFSYVGEESGRFRVTAGDSLPPLRVLFEAPTPLLAGARTGSATAVSSGGGGSGGAEPTRSSRISSKSGFWTSWPRRPLARRSASNPPSSGPPRARWPSRASSSPWRRAGGCGRPWPRGRPGCCC